MRVLLTGSTGRLGGAFLSSWRDEPGIDLHVMTRRDADLSHPDEVGDYLEGVSFDVLVNPAAMSGLEECLDSPEEAQAVNVESPRIMAEVCARKGASLVHFSTDYVFSGEGEAMKTEADPVGAVNVYGRTKQAGEQAVLDACADALVCRVSWLFGSVPLGRLTHFDQVLQRAESGEAQCLIADKFSMPTYMDDVVGWVRVLLDNQSTGIYHLCNTGKPESWHSYAEKICDLARRLGYELGEVSLEPMALEEAHFFREKRPVHTAMRPARLESEGLVSPRHWMEAAEVYLKIR